MQKPASSSKKTYYTSKVLLLRELAAKILTAHQFTIAECDRVRERGGERGGRERGRERGREGGGREREREGREREEERGWGKRERDKKKNLTTYQSILVECDSVCDMQPTASSRGLAKHKSTHRLVEPGYVP